MASGNDNQIKRKDVHYVRFPSYLFLFMFLTIIGYTTGSIYWIVKKDNEVEKYRRIELDLQNQIKERDLNIQQFRQQVEQLERRVEIYDAVRELSHASVPQDSQKKIAKVVDETCQVFGMDPYLVLSLMSAESTMRPWAKSSKGAQGLMQILPATGRSLADMVKEEPKLLGLRDGEDLPALTVKDIESNVQLGVLYLTKLKMRYNNNIEEAIYAYNLGPYLYDKRKAAGEAVPRKYYQKVMTKYQELTLRYTGKPHTPATVVAYNDSIRTIQ